MKKTAVIYWSGTGNTETMANAIADSMRAAGADCAVLTPDTVDAGGLDAHGRGGRSAGLSAGGHAARAAARGAVSGETAYRRGGRL